MITTFVVSASLDRGVLEDAATQHHVEIEETVWFGEDTMYLSVVTPDDPAALEAFRQAVGGEACV